VFDTAPVASVQSKYQKIEVLKSDFFGHILTIDGDLMLTERDEFIYHEMIVHVPMAYVPTASRILVVGGGDGGSARQLLRRESVERVTVVELDEEVVRISREFFPRLAAALGDDRVELRLESGADWVARQVAQKEAEKFDIAIVDSTDFGASEPLFEEAFHRRLRQLLAKGGVLVINLTSLPWQLGQVQASVYRQRLLFKYVRVFQIYQPTYTSGHYCFLICSDEKDPLDTGSVDWQSYEDEELEMGYYSRRVHEAAFALPQYAVVAISEAMEKAVRDRRGATGKEAMEKAVLVYTLSNTILSVNCRAFRLALPWLTSPLHLKNGALGFLPMVEMTFLLVSGLASANIVFVRPEQYHQLLTALLLWLSTFFALLPLCCETMAAMVVAYVA
ncbi:speE, partial [Symbiodinium sp. KB8]